MSDRYYEPTDIKIYVVENRKLIEEKSLIAVRMEEQRMKIIAIGNEVEEVWKNKEDIKIISPIHQGEIEDYIVAENIFKYIIKKAWGKRMKKPKVGYCVMQKLNRISQKLYEDLLYNAGAKNVKFLGEIQGNFLEIIPKNEIDKYDIIIYLTKSDYSAFVKERAEEMLQYAERLGVSKEELLELFMEL